MHIKPQKQFVLAALRPSQGHLLDGTLSGPQAPTLLLLSSEKPKQPP